MRTLTFTALVILAASSVIAADKPVATVQLPCESQYQDLSPAGNQLAVHCKGGGLRLLEVPSGTEQRAFTPISTPIAPSTRTTVIGWHWDSKMAASKCYPLAAAALPNAGSPARSASTRSIFSPMENPSLLDPSIVPPKFGQSSLLRLFKRHCLSPSAGLSTSM